MEEGNTHIPLLGQFFYGEGLAEVLFDPAIGLIDFFCLSDISNALQELPATGAAEQIIEDLLHNIFPQEFRLDLLAHRGEKPVNSLHHHAV